MPYREPDGPERVSNATIERDRRMLAERELVASAVAAVAMAVYGVISGSLFWGALAFVVGLISMLKASRSLR